MGRPKGKLNIPPEVKNRVRKLLWKNQTLSGKELKFETEKELTVAYSERTYQNIKEDLLPGIIALKNSNLEQIWTIAACANPEYDIPAGMIPMLIKEKRLRINTNLGPRDLTIREAIWFGRLYSVIFPIAEGLHKETDHPDLSHGIVSLVSRQYAIRELQNALEEVEEKLYVWDLDYWLSVKEDPGHWEPLKSLVNDMLWDPRDSYYAKEKGEKEPPKIDGFITYFESISDIDTEEGKQ